MRPLSLELSGFRSYEHLTHISFEDRNLIAIVGPTGSGKSSLLDGIAYALYGMTPRLRRGTKRLICTRSDALHVRLRFSVDERVYEVTRALPRSGSGECVLVEEGSGDRIMGAEEVTRKVTQLVGLDFDGFCSSVLLAQNRFSRFLDASPKDRVNILKGVFRLERIDELRAAAKARSVGLEVDLATIDGELRTIPEDAAEQLEEVRTGAQSSRERSVELDRAQPEERRLEEAAGRAREAADAAQARLTELGELSGRLPAGDDLDALAQEEGAIGARLRRAEEDLAEHERVLAEAAQELSRLEAEAGSESTLAEARSWVAQLTEVDVELARLNEETDTKGSELRSHNERLDRAKATETAARAALDEAREAHESAKRAHSAHALRAGLEPGDSCPVCLQEIAKLPRARRPAALSSAERAEKAAQAALVDAQGASQQIAGDLAATESSLRHCSEASERARTRRKGLLERLLGIVGQTDDPGAEIEARLERLLDAKRRVQQASVSREELQQKRETCIAEGARFAARRQAVAAVLIRLADRLDLEPVAVDDPAEKLGEHAEAARAALLNAAAGADAQLQDARARRAEAESALGDLRVSLRLTTESITEAFARALAEARVAEERAASLEKQLARAAELGAERQELLRRQRVFDRLAEDFRDNNFVHFLLEDRRRLLAELGSERLREMSRRYRFDDLGEFNVVDELDGDKLRETETLSGGETFLASLALALALAEAVARSGGRLQCFFLDEGFGSLDSESLDLALDGIERIVSPGRLIGLVSHVAALAQRVDDRIELGKDADGMTVVQEGAARG